MSGMVQAWLAGALVLAAALHLAWRWAPATWRSGLQRRLGRTAPVQAGNGCGGCSGCAGTPARAAGCQPITVHPRRPR